jgi:hypothetical protein
VVAKDVVETPSDDPLEFKEDYQQQQQQQQSMEGKPVKTRQFDSIHIIKAKNRFWHQLCEFQWALRVVYGRLLQVQLQRYIRGGT